MSCAGELGGGEVLSDGWAAFSCVEEMLTGVRIVSCHFTGGVIPFDVGQLVLLVFDL